MLSIALMPLCTFADIVENYENKWTTHASASQCEIVYDIEGVGKALFIKKSGLALNFSLRLLSKLELGAGQKQEWILSAKNPDWVDSGSTSILGRFSFIINDDQEVVLSSFVPDKSKNKEKNNIFLNLNTAQLFQVLASGKSIIFPDANFYTNAALPQIVSAVGFREAQEKYELCVKQMIPYDFESLKLMRLYFSSGSAMLSVENKEKLDVIIRYISNDNSISKIELGGHADRVGGYSDNRLLANRRLWNVKDYLVFRGVTPSLIEARGYGDAKPIAPQNKAGRAKNRRVEIKLFY